MDFTFVHIASTVLGLICFVAICIQAYSKGAKKKFEQAAHIPFDEDDQPHEAASSDEKQG
ncbi:cbb3-type cytochrome c oxidase subunit 3 [Niveibacterium sp. SC-1]|uniref:cbb3-type cytochrome oxidase subunit 3 n=1 Tax=Niveibacterium sp. SC-1 TaxID=3135646 RepID=UPI00311EC991